MEVDIKSDEYINVTYFISMHLPCSYHLNFTITYAWSLAIHYSI